MDIRNRRILVLGGWGLVGTAILHKLAERQPEKVIILSLRQSEAEEACQTMSATYPDIQFVPEWGNIFVRDTLKDLTREELLDNPVHRQTLLDDTMEEFTDEKLGASFLHQVISRHKPHIIIDSINTATALAYQDLYSGYYHLKPLLEDPGRSADQLNGEVEKMLTTLYIPQIIRHIQILHASMVQNQTGVYIKIGTTGTGGMGLNIPYTHSEERPSRVLLSKSSLAGAHTLLLFLMGRTPGGPICKEIKPAAAIAWKGIQYGEVRKHGQPIRLVDCRPEDAMVLGGTCDVTYRGTWQDLKDNLKSVYIDTGENGIFSLGEFETITSAGQMEFVTPEEIAENVILEILGDSTGHDIINALDNSIMGPTYRAGYMRHQALQEMQRLEKEYNTCSVAFEILGPPRLSKLLHEAHLIQGVIGNLRDLPQHEPEEVSRKAEARIQSDQQARAEILSIGIPILLPDGKRLLRGPEIKIPVYRGEDTLPITPENLEEWAHAGWVDLRVTNMRRWQARIQGILDYIHSLPPEDTSSQYHHGLRYWGQDQPFNIGKVAAWIFIQEDKGARIKR
ncbi:MAG: short-chain dehydrogenase [Candidatus Neomarinimicrobiota bacterium]|nr:MAG: short-chain dehydrogenase [Candidatus Neomarinimicrobiota bacterium]